MRVPMQVDRKKLVEALAEAEKNGPLKNQQAVWEAAAKIYNDTSSKDISAGVVRLRAIDWGIKIQTPMGKKGRAAGVPLSEEQKAAMQAGRSKVNRAERLAKNPQFAEHIRQLRLRTPERFQPLVDAIENGSKAAAMKLNCLECSSYVTSEVRQCVCVHCPVWAFRPYQGAIELDETGESLDEAIDEAVLEAVA